MKKFVKVVKPFRYATRVFKPGEIGEVVTVEHPLMWEGKPIYDYYVSFPDCKPIGVKKDEVEEYTYTSF